MHGVQGWPYRSTRPPHDFAGTFNALQELVALLQVSALLTGEVVLEILIQADVVGRFYFFLSLHGRRRFLLE